MNTGTIFTIIPWQPSNSEGLAFCRETVKRVNRHPNRAAELKFDATRIHCKVVDDAVPILDPANNHIVDWKRPAIA